MIQLIILSVVVGVLVALINNSTLNSYLQKLPEWLDKKSSDSSGAFRLFYRILAAFMGIPSATGDERIKSALRGSLTILFPFVAAFLLWLPILGLIFRILPVFSEDAKKIADAYEEGKKIGNDANRRGK